MASNDRRVEQFWLDRVVGLLSVRFLGCSRSVSHCGIAVSHWSNANAIFFDCFPRKRGRQSWSPRRTRQVNRDRSSFFNGTTPLRARGGPCVVREAQRPRHRCRLILDHHASDHKKNTQQHGSVCQRANQRHTTLLAEREGKHSPSTSHLFLVSKDDTFRKRKLV